MKFGYWLPIFGGWLRNVEDEQMATSWDYVKQLAQRSEDWGYSLTLIAELYLNDIKGQEAPALEAWSTAAALAAVTKELEIMVAVRPTLHFEQHDDRYARTKEWLDVVTNVWERDHFSYDGKYYQLTDNVLQPKPAKKPFLYAGGESEAAKDLISTQCDGYVMHGDSPEQIGQRIADMRRRREQKNLPPMKFGVAGYSIVRDNEQDVKRELDRITNVQSSAAGYGNYQQWLAGTQLEQQVSLHDYSVSNRGLRTGLTGTPAQIQDRIGAYEAVGVDFFLLQCSPQLEEMERFSESVISVLA